MKYVVLNVIGNDDNPCSLVIEEVETGVESVATPAELETIAYYDGLFMAVRVEGGVE